MRAPPSCASEAGEEAIDERRAAIDRDRIARVHPPGRAVDARLCDPASAGLVKLDAMENPFRLPEALQRELGERLGAGRDQPLSGALRRPT